MLFYNAGSESIQASVVEYSTFVEGTKVKNKTIGQFEVLGKGWARGAGGFHVDLALAEKIADAFNEQWKRRRRARPATCAPWPDRWRRSARAPRRPRRS